MCRTARASRQRSRRRPHPQTSRLPFLPPSGLRHSRPDKARQPRPQPLWQPRLTSLPRSRVSQRNIPLFSGLRLHRPSISDRTSRCRCRRGAAAADPTASLGTAEPAADLGQTRSEAPKPNGAATDKNAARQQASAPRVTPPPIGPLKAQPHPPLVSMAKAEPVSLLNLGPVRFRTCSTEAERPHLNRTCGAGR